MPTQRHQLSCDHCHAEFTAEHKLAQPGGSMRTMPVELDCHAEERRLCAKEVPWLVLDVLAGFLPNRQESLTFPPTLPASTGPNQAGVRRGPTPACASIRGHYRTVPARHSGVAACGRRHSRALGHANVRILWTFVRAWAPPCARRLAAALAGGLRAWHWHSPSPG
ncbi:hypothetical protein LCGC14_1610980 [marine sediment metagenome]|uniref:Uncharacterized protein n=1 Tax=marine sediment metagenome TaxID=412755 RepID=A0A0F9I8K4_9ZZZZ